MVLVAVLIAFLTIGSANYYVARKIHKGLEVYFPKVKFWVILSFFLLSTFVFVCGFLRNTLPLPQAIKEFVGVVSFYWMGIFLYLFMFTILSDVVLLLLRLFRLKAIKKPITKAVSVLGILLLTVVTSAYGFYNARDVERVSYDVKLESKTDISDLKIVMFSDLHLGAVGCEGRLQSIVEKINAQEPDIVCIAGDVFDSSTQSINDPEKAIETLSGIDATYGVYACLGNHDAGKDFAKMIDFLNHANITVLNDEYVVIDGRLILMGRLDKSAIGGNRGIDRKDLKSFYKGNINDLPVVVLEHNPVNYSEYSNEVDLILSGHTHKGQIFPVSLVTDIIYEVDHGYYRRDDKSPQIIVSSGIGYWGMPMRVGSDSELIVINFKK